MYHTGFPHYVITIHVLANSEITILFRNPFFLNYNRMNLMQHEFHDLRKVVILIIVSEYCCSGEFRRRRLVDGPKMAFSHFVQ